MLVKNRAYTAAVTTYKQEKRIGKENNKKTPKNRVGLVIYVGFLFPDRVLKEHHIRRCF